jgi:hypothetical protein
LQIFGAHHECYVPDAQIIYPEVFLSDVAVLPPPNNTYRDCITALRRNFVVKFLPENDADFNRLILRKFMAFLDDIKNEALSAKNKRLSADQFRNNVNNLFRIRKLYDDRDCGDLLLYWDSHSEDFVTWLKWDRIAIENRILELVREMLERYKSYTEPLKHKWTEPDKEMILLIFNLLKSERTKGLLTNGAHDEDLRLLAGCLFYACGNKEKGLSGYLPEGVLYLVTNDDDFYNCGKQVKSLESLGAGNGKRITGFDVVKPKAFLDKLKQHNSTL